MKAPPVLLLGGSSPVVAYLRHSMMVCTSQPTFKTVCLRAPTVFPDPFQPTIRVSGEVKWIASPLLGPKERMLQGSAEVDRKAAGKTHPMICIRSICAVGHG